MSNLSLSGIIPPLPTPFDDNQDFAPARLQENIRRLSDFKLAGFLVLGSNGELAHLADREIPAVYEAAREAISGPRLMLAGVGAQSTRRTIANARAAAAAGADAVLVLNPSYYKGQMAREALRAHYHAVAEAATVPVILYNMPAATGLDMDAETVVAIAGHENIIGIKDSGGNVVKLGEIRRNTPPDFQILAGSAGFLLPALSVGAVGGILALANIATQQCLDLFLHFQAGDLQAARDMQIRLIPVNTAVTAKWGVPGLKAALDLLGLYGGPPRAPLLPAGPDIRRQLSELMEIHLQKTGRNES